MTSRRSYCELMTGGQVLPSLLLQLTADAAAHPLIIAFFQVPQTSSSAHPAIKATQTRAQGKEFVPPRVPHCGGCRGGTVLAQHPRRRARFVPAALQRRGQQDVLHRARGLLPASAAAGFLSCSEQLASDSAKPGAGIEQVFPDLARAR